MAAVARTSLLAAAALVLSATAGTAERAKPDPRDVAAVRDCLKSERGAKNFGEPCIGVIADPCMEDDQKQSTADQVACSARELAVWDDMLNDSFRRLRDNLDNKQKVKLREMQRAWVTSRERTCDFYWDYFQGTMASPMSAYCNLRETARRALFLKRFLDDSEGR